MYGFGACSRGSSMLKPMLGAPLVCATIGGLHDAGAAAGDDGEPRGARAPVGVADDAPELARDAVIHAVLDEPARRRDGVTPARIVRTRRKQAMGFVQPRVRDGRGNDARAAVDHDSMADALVLQAFLGLPVVELQPDAAHARALQDGGIVVGGRAVRAVGKTRRAMRDALDAVVADDRIGPRACAFAARVHRRQAGGGTSAHSASTSDTGGNAFDDGRHERLAGGPVTG